VKEILKCLEAILHRGYSSFTIFNDWLDLMLYALQRDDPPYLEIVRKYKNDKPKGEREIDYFTSAFAQLQIEMSKTNDDILGQVYMQWNMNNKYRGQFFTPKHVASMMAKITNPLGRILDPCCGSGVMLVEAIKTMDSDAIEQSAFYGQDIDLTCVKMCALNLLFFNVNGYVVWGDSLLMECNKVYQTKRSYMGGSISELTGEALESFKTGYLASLEKTLKDMPVKALTHEDIQKLTARGEQLSFF
jgi:hypothetical protein